MLPPAAASGAARLEHGGARLSAFHRGSRWAVVTPQLSSRPCFLGGDCLPVDYRGKSPLWRRWRDRLAAMGMATALLGAVAPAYGSFGPTTILTLPSGIVGSRLNPIGRGGCDSAFASASCRAVITVALAGLRPGSSLLSSQTPQLASPPCHGRGDLEVNGASRMSCFVGQPASCSTAHITTATGYASGALASYTTSNEVGGICATARAKTGTFNERGDRSEINSFCWARIMLSSNSNRNIVAVASIITPKNTQAVGSVNKWPSRQASQIIPAPTKMPPTTAAKISTNCVVDGSPPPERNWKIYAKVAAPLTLILFGAAFGAVAIIRWFCHWLRRRE
jgi:hypothetical protein